MEGVRGFVKGYGENKVPERERKALRTLGMAGCQLSFGIKGGYRHVLNMTKCQALC